MRAVRFVGATCAALAITTALAGSAQAEAATADTSPSGAEQAGQAVGTSDGERAFCMDRAGLFRDTGKGVSYKGRYTILETESLADLQASGYAEDIATGDRVVVERSHKSFLMGVDPQYPDDEEIGYNYGACSSREATWWDANVRDWIKSPAVRLQIPDTPALRSYAVRSCVKPVEGGKKCTRWFVDHI
jgi:hypothetical protein